MSKRAEYYHDPHTPAANPLVPGGSAPAVDDAGRILLQRRADSGNWSLPGRTMEVGETLAAAVVRETRGRPDSMSRWPASLGVHTGPRRVIAHQDGEVRQEVVVVFAARSVGGDLAVSHESSDLRYVDPDELDVLPTNESVRLRMRRYLERRDQPYLG